MKLKNKKTGEIVEATDFNIISEYNSLAELNEDWEDYEEPKGSALDVMILTLSNFIENEPDEDKVDLDDCKQLLEKLKAWKRLKDRGFEFKDFARINDQACIIRATFDESWSELYDDLNSLFGGEE